MDKVKKYLPVGSVVLLKKGKRKVLIIGYFSAESQTKVKVYDYIGCLYPEGLYKANLSVGFNHDDIKEIYYMGYSDEEFKSFDDKLKDFKKLYVDENGNLKKTPKELLANVPKN